MHVLFWKKTPVFSNITIEKEMASNLATSGMSHFEISWKNDLFCVSNIPKRIRNEAIFAFKSRECIPTSWANMH